MIVLLAEPQTEKKLTAETLIMTKQTFQHSVKASVEYVKGFVLCLQMKHLSALSKMSSFVCESLSLSVPVFVPVCVSLTHSHTLTYRLVSRPMQPRWLFFLSRLLTA